MNDPRTTEPGKLPVVPARFDLPMFLLGLAIGLFIGRMIGGFS